MFARLQRATTSQACSARDLDEVGWRGVLGDMRQLLTPWRLVVTASVALAFGSGCGPILSTYLIVSAQADLDGAKAAEAEKYAVYEYTAASQYLHKAREEQGYADFGPAIDFAFKADEMATKGITRAAEEKKRLAQSPASLPSMSGAAPTAPADTPSVKIVPIPAGQAPGQPAPKE